MNFIIKPIMLKKLSEEIDITQEEFSKISILLLFWYSKNIKEHNKLKLFLRELYIHLIGKNKLIPWFIWLIFLFLIYLIISYFLLPISLYLGIAFLFSIYLIEINNTRTKYIIQKTGIKTILIFLLIIYWFSFIQNWPTYWNTHSKPFYTKIIKDGLTPTDKILTSKNINIYLKKIKASILERIDKKESSDNLWKG